MTTLRSQTLSSDLYAALDLGSNSFHLLVGRLQDDKIETVDRVKDTVRLAAGLQADRSLSEEAKDRALESLARFAQRIGGIPPKHIRVVATNTFRVASESGKFRQQAEAALGVPIEIISGQEEARLIFLGVAKDFAPDRQKRLVVDIGGGSTELIIGKREPQLLESLHMGCVTWTQRYFPKGMDGSRYKKAVINAKSVLQPHVKQFSSIGFADTVGSSGTIRAIGELMPLVGGNVHEITLKGLQDLADRWINKPDKLDLSSVSSNRLGVLPGGMAVLQALLESLPVEVMHTSVYTMKEGVLYDLAGKTAHYDRRERTVSRMMSMYNADVEQADRVYDSAELLLGKVAGHLQLEADVAREYLEWATDLHEIGLAVAHGGHQKLGAWLVENSDMPGFTRREQATLSFLIRNQRKAITPNISDYGIIEDWTLVLVLRLAILFNRSRAPQKIPTLDFTLKSKRFDLYIPGAWLNDHPLTQFDLERESSYWNAVEIDFKVCET